MGVLLRGVWDVFERGIGGWWWEEGYVGGGEEGEGGEEGIAQGYKGEI